MNNQITYDKIFKIMNVKDIVIFEDIFSVKNTKNEICYGLVRMAEKNRNNILKELEKIDAYGKEQLESFIVEFDKVFDAIYNWNDEIPYNDIETAFEIIEKNTKYSNIVPAIKEKYKEISIESWENKDRMLAILASYGAGVEVPNLYEEIFSEHIQKEAHWKQFRVFRDFTAMTREDFKQYIERSLKDENTILCIVDDQLRNEKCAKEITQFIEENLTERKDRLKIIGVIYSSFKNDDCISDKIYFEYMKKETSSKSKFQAALTKSMYSYMLSELKEIYQNVLVQSFDEAIKNKNIAYYLSSMADCEGVTNYQVITNWINLLFEYKLDDTKDLFAVARMTRLINLLEDEQVQFSKEMLELNTFEAFDFNINKYREPIASGDVFISNKKIYILVGQDCDMMYSSVRPRKNGISELVTASTVNQCNIDNSVKLNSEYVFISNFRKSKEGEVKTLKIRYSSREFIDNQILQLCQFNDDGECIIDINELQYNVIGIEPTYYEELYTELVSYFNAISHISKSERHALEVIVNSQQSNRLLTLLNYDEQQSQNGIFKYKLRRVCRLKHPYVLYLYKMYLEYQGRHPFDCMNMSRVQEIQVMVMQHENMSLTVDVVLTPDREANRTHIGSMDWYADLSALEHVVSQILGEPIELNGTKQCVEIGKTETELECILKSGERKKIEIMKINDSVSIEVK